MPGNGNGKTAADLHLPGGQVVARYRDGGGLDASLSPRPHLHPVRTLSGRVMTAVQPDDHPWHLGVSVAVPDVDGTNLWGGPTFVAGEGYADRGDHGRIRHLGWAERDRSGFVASLGWEDAAGATLLRERWGVRAEPVAHAALADRAWLLRVRFSLSAPPGRDIALRSPQTNGRPGAAYGGFFWRGAFPAGCRARTSAGGDEATANGSRATWVALTGAAGDGTLAFAAAGHGDPWFVRAAEYPGVGAALAEDEPLIVPGGGTVARAIDVVVADGVLSAEEIDLLLPARP